MLKVLSSKQKMEYAIGIWKRLRSGGRYKCAYWSTFNPVSVSAWGLRPTCPLCSAHSRRLLSPHSTPRGPLRIRNRNTERFTSTIIWLFPNTETSRIVFSMIVKAGFVGLYCYFKLAFIFITIKVFNECKESLCLYVLVHFCTRILNNIYT